MNNKQTIISEGKRPMVHLVLASLCFTLAFILLAMSLFEYDPFPKKGYTFKNEFNPFIFFYLMAQGIFFSKVKNIHFRLEENKYKEEYCVGPFKLGKWKELPKIEYVSVFRQLKENDDHVYRTNLWYGRNKHYAIYENLDLDTSMAMGKAIAKTLKIDLYDATKPNNPKWVTVS